MRFENMSFTRKPSVMLAIAVVILVTMVVTVLNR